MRVLYLLAILSIPLTLLAIGFYSLYGMNSIPTPQQQLNQLFYPGLIGFLYLTIIFKAFKLKKEVAKSAIELNIYIFVYSILFLGVLFWIYTGIMQYKSEVNGESSQQEVKSYPNIDLNNFRGGNLNSD